MRSRTARPTVAASARSAARHAPRHRRAAEPHARHPRQGRSTSADEVVRWARGSCRGSKTCMAIGCRSAEAWRSMPREIGSAFVCVSRRSAAANCKTGSRQAKLASCVEARFRSGAARRCRPRWMRHFLCQRDFPMPDRTLNAPAIDDVVLRPMTSPTCRSRMRCRPNCAGRSARRTGSRCSPHAEGFVAERGGEIVATAQRWRWGERHATIGAVIVTPACQGRRIGQRLMSALLEAWTSTRCCCTPPNKGAASTSGSASCAPANCGSTRASRSQRR